MKIRFFILLTGLWMCSMASAQTYDTNSLTNGLVAYYPFKGNPNDETGNGYNAYISNDTQGVSAGSSNNCILTTNRFGQINSAYKFTGQLGSVTYGFLPASQAVSSWMTISNSQSLMASLTNWSLSCIVKINGFGNDYGSQYILNNCQDYRGIGLAFGCNTSTNFGLTSTGFYIQSVNPGISGITILAPKEIQFGSYYYVTATYNGITSNIYINGSLIVSTNATLSFPYINSLSIGRKLRGSIANPPGYGGDLNGVLDEVRIYNRALSSNEVAQLYALESTPPPVLPPLTVATQPFDQAISLGQNTSFTIEATGTGPFSYQWMKDGVALTYQTNASLVITNAQSNAVGYYSCAVTDANSNSVTSSNAALNISGVPFWLWQGLVANWKLEGNAHDEMGYSPGSPNNVQWLHAINAAGVEKKMAYFDGSSSSIVVPQKII
jgi:hypothetical protein